MKRYLFLLILFSCLNSCATNYPSSWWEEVDESKRKSWEILPQDAKKGEVVLSKRTELGAFSNLALTPFEFENIRYKSVEALWQSLKYPDSKIKNDPRNKLKYPYKREDVYELSGFKSKKAGDKANLLMKSGQIKWVSYKGKKFDYKDMKSGSDFHYKLIYSGILEKILQNKNLEKLLLRTKGLKLVPDHKIRKSSPKSYFHYDILMKIRDGLN